MRRTYLKALGAGILALALSIAALPGCSADNANSNASHEASDTSNVPEAPDTPSNTGAPAEIAVPDGTVYVKCTSSSGYGENDLPVVFESLEGIEAMIGDHPVFYDASGNKMESQTDLAELFPDTFFEDNRLLCAHYTATSGSYKVHIGEIVEQDGTYTVSFVRDKPGKNSMVTGDMAYWTALIPLPKR